MTSPSVSLSRRRLLAGTVVASAAAVTATVAASPAAAAGPVHPAAPAVVRHGIATARLAAPAALQPDLHERLGVWLAFWSANSPHRWSVPVEVVGTADAAGATFTLRAIRVVLEDRPLDAFRAGRGDRTHLGTLASLHHHCGQVSVAADGGLRVVDAAAGFTGAPEQVAFAVAACRELWGVRTAGANTWHHQVGRLDAVSRSGWAAFTRAALRRGLRTDTY
ncbi:hypothetical protein [Verrucosispora sp. WMMD573]|uniref:hypothetical protein n=1 Tax=Verrucosispora sp. WMMD573 TaxID=3015149 RepID=UPI00248BBEA7|nr:hypothetical protein [Verrucosispora sp. WMMD573]WBB56722.1 hypothetical protein O7601_11965 [Verrucosispora sp. WMMD573]